MTWSHGENSVFGVMFCAVVMVIFQGLLMTAVDLAAIGIAANALDAFYAQNCHVLSVHLQLNMSLFALVYGCVDLATSIFRFIYWFLYGCTQNRFGKLFVAAELLSFISRIVVFAFGITMLSMLSSDCEREFFMLKSIAIVIVVAQLPLAICQAVFTRALFRE